MKLYIMRHGPAEDGSPTGEDADRALSREGADRVRRVVDALVKQGEFPREILSSPLVRARETAQLVSDRVFHGKESNLTLRDELAIAGSRMSALVNELLAEGRRRVMLVGHEPTLSHFCETRLGIPLPNGMQKAMVVSASVQLEDGSPTWRVKPRFILDPQSVSWTVL